MNRRYLVAGTILSKRPDNTYEQYTGATQGAGGDQFHLTFVGPPTGGSYDLAVGGVDVAGGNPANYLQYGSISAAAIQTALDGLSTVGAGNATVTGPVADAQGNEVYTVTFANSLGEVHDFVADASRLTGPGNQDIIIQEIQQAEGAYTQNVAGILYDTVEFADGSELSDEPVAMLRRNCSFVAANIIGFAAHSAAVLNALPTCEFI
jgi:hypothetical protein